MKNTAKIAEIGQFPPPSTGWSVRIKHLKEGLIAKGHKCQVMNLGRNRTVKSEDYIDVQNAFDYIIKLIRLKLNGYEFHIHTNAQALKGPVLALMAHLVSFCFGTRASITFHGGCRQKYFPKINAKAMYIIIFLNLFLAKIIICNDEEVKNQILGYSKWIRVQESKVYPIQAFSSQYLDESAKELPSEIDEFMQSKRYIVGCYIAFRNGFDLKTLTDVILKLPNDVGFVITGASKVEDHEVQPYVQKFNDFSDQNRVILIDNLEHSQFLTLLKKVDVFLRTPESDGKSSSVLEALAMGTIVVASENNRRPRDVLTYPAGDKFQLESAIKIALASAKRPKMINNELLPRNTLEEEINLLLKTSASGNCKFYSFLKKN